MKRFKNILPVERGVELHADVADLVVYASQTSIKHSGYLGIVIKKTDDDKVLVMWCREKYIAWCEHQRASLRVITRCSIKNDDD